MKTLMLALTAALSLAGARDVAARDHDHGHHFDGCGITSRYDVQVDGKSLRFTRENGAPAKIEMRHGVLRVDDREIAMSDADHARIAEYEATVRALVPQVKAIARDAADIAYTAVGEVALAFAGDHSDLRSRLDRMHGEVRAKIDASFDSKPWSDKEFDALVESTVAEMVPALVGEVTSMAVKAALSGDEAVAQDIERRAERMEKDIEQRVETQSKQIEARAVALCPQVAQLDHIEDKLEMRLPDGSRLDLVQTHD